MKVGSINKAAFKFARKYAKHFNHPSKNNIISFGGGFHGRTFGSLSATPNPKYQAPFLPLVPVLAINSGILTRSV
jgi:acetylornithine aminotransferase